MKSILAACFFACESILAAPLSGQMTGWGSVGINFVAPGIKFSAIASSSEHSLGITTTGTVVGWGYNYDGEVNIPVGLSSVTAIVAGSEHSMALKSDGTVVAWGGNYYGETNLPPGLSNVVAIAVGDHCLALKNDGTV